jgi:hypothetical protein
VGVRQVAHGSVWDDKGGTAQNLPPVAPNHHPPQHHHHATFSPAEHMRASWRSHVQGTHASARNRTRPLEEEEALLLRMPGRV